MQRVIGPAGCRRAGYDIASGGVPGLVALVSRAGEIHVGAIGKMAFGGAPIASDAIFKDRRHDQAAVAAMILVEECRLRLDDPVDEYLPELANRRVLRGIESDIGDTVPARRANTLRDLLSFRSRASAVMADVWTSAYQAIDD